MAHSDRELCGGVVIAALEQVSGDAEQRFASLDHDRGVTRCRLCERSLRLGAFLVHKQGRQKQGRRTKAQQLGW